MTNQPCYKNSFIHSTNTEALLWTRTFGSLLYFLCGLFSLSLQELNLTQEGGHSAAETHFRKTNENKIFCSKMEAQRLSDQDPRSLGSKSKN
jgi:hypothetical protein